MGKTNRERATRKALSGARALGLLVPILGPILAMTACTHHVQIEPSDKPFVVNLNVKIDHDIRVRVEDKNKDLLNLEDEVTGSSDRKTTSTHGNKEGSKQ